MSFNPLKRRKYGSTKAVVSELFKQAGGIPRVMEILEIGRTRAYDLTDPNNDAELSLERVEKLDKQFSLLAHQRQLLISIIEEEETE